MSLDEDLTPGRTEVNPTSDSYLRKRQRQGGSSFALQRLRTVSSLRRSVTPTVPKKKVPLKLPTPPRDHSVRESLEESRKAQIVKDIVKKGRKKSVPEDKFEPEPILTSAMTRPQGE